MITSTDNLVQRMTTLHGDFVLKKSAMRIRGGAGAFDHFLQGKQYNTILEIGTYKGVSAAIMSQFCKRVITIDLTHGGLEQHGILDWDRNAFWKSLDIHNIELHTITNDREKANLIRNLEFDFAFVDGCHDERVKDDFKAVRKCGRVLFHDAGPDRPGHDWVNKFVLSLKGGRVEFFDIFAMWTRDDLLP